VQNRFAADIGDYVKFAILRALVPGHRLGVAWWLYPDENHNRDGRHIDYLDNPRAWRELEPQAFDHLKAMVTAGDRRVAALEKLVDATYFAEPVPTGSARREAWFGRLKTAVDACDLVFVDPDNGFGAQSFDAAWPEAGKSVTLAELQKLQCRGRALLVYHHQTRMRGGHYHELEYWGTRLRNAGFGRVDALRASSFSPRAFFLLDGSTDLRARAAALAARWGADRLSWRANLGLPRVDRMMLSDACL
jgi:hypothetical protein